MFEITVNGGIIDAEEGENILSALRRAGIRVPTLCDIPGMEPEGACRMCVVEISGEKELFPACSTPVREGMILFTNSRRVNIARRTILELLLAGHPDDCLYCVRARDCTLRKLAQEYGVRRRMLEMPVRRKETDETMNSVRYDPSKCILCGKCVRVCRDVQRVEAFEFAGRGPETEISGPFGDSLSHSGCVGCGQCTLVCPTGALTEKSDLGRVLDSLGDPEIFTTVQIAPSVPVTLAVKLNLKPGTDLSRQLASALGRIGFQAVFDTAFAADLNALETAAELWERLEKKENLPLFTSCSPAWVRFVKEFYPEFIPNLSRVRSPQQILGKAVKTIYAREKNLNPEKIFHVSVMPCTAKKDEAADKRFSGEVDAVLTTREFAELLDLYSFDPVRPAQEIETENIFGRHSSAGRLFGTSGGVAEAILRSFTKLATGHELKSLRLESLRAPGGYRETHIKSGSVEIGIAVASGLEAARELLEKIRSGEKKDLHLVEVMACPGGCVAGGGQIAGTPPEKIRAAMQSLYLLDQADSLRCAHLNPDALDFFSRIGAEGPGSEKAKSFLRLESK